MKLRFYIVTFLLISSSFAIAQEVASTQVIAHRGAWKNAGLPQNSLASLEAAIGLGCYASECDIWMTADSVLVVNHDPEFYGIVIETATYSQLLTQKHPNGEVLPTLKQFLERILVQRETRLVLDIKPSKIAKERSLVLARKCFEMVDGMNAQGMIDYIFFDYDACLLLSDLDPNAHVAYLNGDRSPDEVADDGLSGLDYNYRLFQENKTWITESRKRGLTTNVWTINDTSLMDFFIGEKVDFITTDEPELLLKRIRDMRE